MAEAWAQMLNRWVAAGLLDEGAAARIRAYELAHAGSNRLRWPIWIALGFGALALGAGVLLFVSANWDNLSPAVRFALVTALVAGFHVAGALTVGRFPSMATALHTVGTIALGGGIFLAGQIFNLEEHWPGGLMLWAIGAAAAWALLQSWPQMALTAILTPAWLAGEWIVATETRFAPQDASVLAAGLFLLALAYFTADAPDRHSVHRTVLVRLGGVALPFTAAALAIYSIDRPFYTMQARTLSAGVVALGWAAALGVPLALAGGLRGRAAWQNAAAAVWVLVLLGLDPLAGEVFLYVWWAIGGIAMAAWGTFEGRPERINMGAAIFAATILTFYFSQVMDKLGRSASLIGLGLLFLAGGWAIERARRRLVARARGEQG